MKRILGMVVAIAAVLAYSSAASATEITFDLTGSGISWSRSADASAEIEGAPYYGGPCTPGLYSPPAPAGAGDTCFRYAFASGSSVTVDITGNVVTMIGGSIHLDTTATPTILAFGTINLATNLVTTMFGATATTAAATGILTGDSILWSTPVNVRSVGTLQCIAPPASAGGQCGAIGMGTGSSPPVSFEPTFSAISNTSGVTALVLGQWDLNALHDQILASSNAVTRWSGVAELGNRRSGVLTFGPAGLGNPAPEPGTAALILLGLGALAVRSRKA